MLDSSHHIWGNSQKTSGWPRRRGSAESGRSMVIRMWFYCFIWMQGEGVCRIRIFNCYSNVILLFYPDAGGTGGLQIRVLAGHPLWMAPYRKDWKYYHYYIPWILDLAPGGLLSILKFGMGAYSRGSSFEGGGLLKRFVLYMGAYSKLRVFCML